MSLASHQQPESGLQDNKPNQGAWLHLLVHLPNIPPEMPHSRGCTGHPMQERGIPIPKSTAVRHHLHKLTRRSYCAALSTATRNQLVIAES